MNNQGDKAKIFTMKGEKTTRKPSQDDENIMVSYLSLDSFLSEPHCFGWGAPAGRCLGTSFSLKGKSRFLLLSPHFVSLYTDVTFWKTFWKHKKAAHNTIIIAKQFFPHINISFEFLFISRCSYHKIATEEYILFYWVAF